MRAISALLLALCCGPAAAVEVYKWVDQNGVVHYGDKPKHGAEALDVRQPPPSETALAEAARQQEARTADCQKRRAQLDSYRKATAIKETDGLGRTREYSEAERLAFLERTEKQVAEACAGVP